MKSGDVVSVTSVVASVVAVAPARGSPRHPGGSRWTTRVLLTCGGVVAGASVLATLVAVAEIHHLYFSRHNLPDLDAFMRFEFPTIGHVYDASGKPLIELAREYREIAWYEDIPRSFVTRSCRPRISASSPTTGSTMPPSLAC